MNLETTLAEIKRERANIAKAIPTERDALDLIQVAYSRLKSLGWNDGMYMPKDGTTVTVMQVGSTGTFDCYYSGEWADGYFNVMDGGDVYPTQSAPPLFKPKANK